MKEIARCWSLLNKEDRLVYKTEAKRGKFELYVFNVVGFIISIKSQAESCFDIYRIFADKNFSLI